MSDALDQALDDLIEQDLIRDEKAKTQKDKEVLKEDLYSITRDEEGNVTDGKVNFKVPKDRSFLSVLSVNAPYDGCSFDADYYIRDRDKNIIHKWFETLPGFSSYGNDPRIWPPKYQDKSYIPHLESRRWYYLQARESIGHRFDEVCDVLRTSPEKLVRGWMPLASSRSKGEIVLEYSDYHGTPGISFTWINLIDYFKWSDYEEKLNKCHVNQKIIDKYFNWEDRMSSLSMRYQIFQCAFLKSINYQYRKKVSSHDMSYGAYTLHLVINNRNYWFRESTQLGDQFIIMPFSNPEDLRTEEIIL